MKTYVRKARSVVLAAAVLGVPALAVLPLTATTACYGRDCDQADLYGKPTDGNMLDNDTWESSSMDGEWLDFGGAHVWHIDLTKLGGRQPDMIIGYISAQQFLSTDDGNGGKIARKFTTGGGNTFELSEVKSTGLVVHNLTCAQYYLRLVVHAPASNRTQFVDAGTDAAKSDAAP